jgi:hypothetical protein
MTDGPDSPAAPPRARPHDASVSRLDRMLARLSAQKAVLERAVAEIADRPGPVVEIGLGKGRTYDHLRRLLPDRTIRVFDGSIHCPADCRPPEALLTLGDFRQTLPAAADLIGRAVLVHADFGTEDPARDEAMAAALAGPIVDLAAPGGLVAGDRPLDDPRLAEVTPGGLAWPYRLWRVTG